MTHKPRNLHLANIYTNPLRNCHPFDVSIREVSRYETCFDLLPSLVDVHGPPQHIIHHTVFNVKGWSTSE